MIERVAAELAPIQVGVGVKGGSEAAVHAARRFLASIRDNPDEVIVKLDFRNAFKCLRRDCMLEQVAKMVQEIYAFCLNAYSGQPLILFNNSHIESATGVQQGDPLGPLLFSITLHPILLRAVSELKVGYLDDVTIGGSIQDVETDVELIREHAQTIGLDLNPSKCEIIGECSVSNDSICHDFVRVSWEDAELLGSPLSQGNKQNTILESKCSQLTTAMSRLHLLDAHYALSIISNCISAPKLMYTLGTSCCFANDLLARFDIVVRNGLESVLNIQMSDMQWLQASLPVREGGLGVRSVVSLAPSAFLASAVSTRSLQNELIPHIASLNDTDFDTCMAHWSELSLCDPVTGVGADKQWIWDSLVVDKMKGHLFSLCETDLDKARILAASAPRAGDWLHVIPSANCGLFLENEEVRTAVSVRLGAPVCITYDCACGMTVDRLGLHCFSCKKCPGRYTRHSLLNDVVWRSFQRAKIQAQKEPAGLAVSIPKSDGTTALKRPDGASLIPWKRGRSIAWDVTVANTFAASYISATEVEAGSAAERAAQLKITKYNEIARNHIFVPLACEVTGVWCSEAIDFIYELGNRISAATSDRRESSFLFQRLSIAL